MQKLSRQQEIIVKALRSKDWVCGSVWLSGIKDDRARISKLNKGYMKEHGWKIMGKPCDGRCGTTHSSNLYMRRAERLHASQSLPDPIQDESEVIRQMDIYWNSIPPKTLKSL